MEKNRWDPGRSTSKGSGSEQDWPFLAVLRIRINFLQLRIQAKITMTIRIHELTSTTASKIPVKGVFQLFILK